MTESASELPAFHDGQLSGILVKDGEARLLVTDVGGARFTLILSGVKRLNADGFAEGNIILDCTVSVDPAIPSDILAAINHGRTEGKSLDALRSLLANGSHQMFVLAPSYGATVVGLVEAVTVVPGFVVS